MSTTYSEFRPTALDRHIRIEGRENWLVLPISRNRDTTDSLSIANWQSILEHLGGESETLEVHRFGHWACGWFEIALLDPSRVAAFDEITEKLESYLVFDDSKLSEVESESETEDWESWGRDEFKRQLLGGYSGTTLGEAIDELTNEQLDSLWQGVADSLNWACEHGSEGSRFNFDGAVENLDTDAIWQAIDEDTESDQP